MGVLSLTRMSQLAEACTARSIKPFNQPGLSGTYPNQSSRLLVVWICIEKYHPVKDFDKEGWKNASFSQNTTLQTYMGAFMLPKYVEDILEEEEGKKMSRLLSYWMWGRCPLLFQRFAKIAKPLQRL